MLERKRARMELLCDDLATHFSGHRSCVLEIGCGHGHYLAAYAQAHPDQRCLGIDLVSKRIEKSLRKADVRALKNLHFMKAEIDEFLECLPEGISFDAVFMLFPDPWPKKRHHKNRMIQTAFLDALAARCPEATPFYFRTDHKGYYDWTREHIAAHPAWGFDNDAPWPFENSSFFQDLMDSYQSLVARRVG